MRAASAAAAAAGINPGSAPHAVARVLHSTSSTAPSPGYINPAAAASNNSNNSPNSNNDETTTPSSPSSSTDESVTSPAAEPAYVSSPSINAPISAASLLPQTPHDIAFNAARTAVAGGLPGAAATSMQISCFMWLQTTVSNQYRSGLPTFTALKKLYQQGGIRRLYSGYSATLLHGTLARFGDTAANAGVLALLDAGENTRDLPVVVKTFGSSVVAASWRAFLTPIEHFRMNMQTRGKEKGLGNVQRRVGLLGVRSLYHGSMALGLASVAQHFPWFCTFNYLNSVIPLKDDAGNGLKMVRHGCMGFASSFVSDITSNFFKIMATIRITSKRKVGYVDAAKRILDSDGIMGLFSRGLKTRIISNGLQGLVFAVAWKQLEARFFGEYVKEGMGDPIAKQRIRRELEAAAAALALQEKSDKTG